MSALLLKTTLKKSNNSQQSMIEMFSLLNKWIENHIMERDKYIQEIESSKICQESLINEISVITTNRESFLDDFTLKLCLLLNSKKEMIKGLQDEIHYLKRSNVSTATNDNESFDESNSDKEDIREPMKSIVPEFVVDTTTSSKVTATSKAKKVTKRANNVSTRGDTVY
jgi:hypothetical protein